MTVPVSASGREDCSRATRSVKNGASASLTGSGTGTFLPEMAQGGDDSRFGVPVERVIDSTSNVTLRDPDSLSQWEAKRQIRSDRRGQGAAGSWVETPWRYGSENSWGPSESINRSTA